MGSNAPNQIISGVSINDQCGSVSNMNTELRVVESIHGPKRSLHISNPVAERTRKERKLNRAQYGCLRQTQ